MRPRERDGPVRWRLGAPLIVSALLVVAAGCRSAPADPEAGGAAIELAWRAFPADVAVRAPGSLLVPPPRGAPGMALVSLKAPEPARGAGDPDPRGWASQTLYADPGRPDPVRDRSLVVARSPYSDVEGGFGVGGGDEVTIAGQRGRIVQRRSVWIATWPLPVREPVCACDQEGLVAGRGLSRSEVLDAARHAQVLATRPFVPASARPDGLAPVGTARVFTSDPVARGRGETLELAYGETRAELQVVADEPRLAEHLGFWVADGDVAVQFTEDRYASVYRQAGELVAAGDISPGPRDVAAERTRRAIRALRPGTEADGEAALRASLTRPVGPDDTCDLGPRQAGEATGYLAGQTAEARWVVGLAASAKGYRTCEAIATLDGGGRSEGPGVGGALAPPPAGGVRLLAGGGTGTTGGAAHFLVAGDVPDTAVKVVVTFPDGPRTQAVLGASGLPGRRWFAAIWTSPGQPSPLAVDPPRVAAYDQDGRLVAATP